MIPRTFLFKVGCKCFMKRDPLMMLRLYQAWPTEICIWKWIPWSSQYSHFDLVFHKAWIWGPDVVIPTMFVTRNVIYTTIWYTTNVFKTTTSSLPLKMESANYTVGKNGLNITNIPSHSLDIFLFLIPPTISVNFTMFTSNLFQ